MNTRKQTQQTIAERAELYSAIARMYQHLVDGGLGDAPAA